jgi:hypothetical protein
MRCCTVGLLLMLAAEPVLAQAGRAPLHLDSGSVVRELTRVEVRRGSRTVRGALIGAGFGTLAGLFALWAQGLADGPPLSSGRRALTVAGSVAGWGGIGALIGAMSDNWAAAP